MSAKVTIAKAGSPEEISGDAFNAAVSAILPAITKSLDIARIENLPALRITVEVSKGEEAVSKPFAGFENFEACVLHQTGKGHSAESAHKICGALQRDTEKEGDEPQSAGAEMPVPGEKKPSDTEKILAKGFSIFKTAEERFVLGIVLEPTKELNKPDSQGDIYSADEVRMAADKFMEEYQQIGVQHSEITKAVKILRNWITLDDCTINGQVVAKGTWLLGVRVQDDDLWEKVKKGEITAFSIGGKANREPVT